jgi:hypothetical protein
MVGYIRKAKIGWIRISTMCSLLALLLLVVAQSGRAQDTKFTGEITDEHLNCVQSTRPYPLLDNKRRPPATEGTTKGACVLYWAHFANPAGSKTIHVTDVTSIAAPFAAPNDTAKQ